MFSSLSGYLLWHWSLIRLNLFPVFERISWLLCNLLILQGGWIASKLKSWNPPIRFIVSWSEYDWTSQYIVDVGESLCVQIFFLKKQQELQRIVCWHITRHLLLVLCLLAHVYNNTGFVSQIRPDRMLDFCFRQIRFLTTHLPSLFLKGPPLFKCFPDRHVRCIPYICGTFPVLFKLLICSIVTN